MRRIIVAAIFAAGICWAGIKTASAADFYWAGSSDMEHVTLLDPTTISVLQGGHKSNCGMTPGSKSTAQATMCG